MDIYLNYLKSIDNNTSFMSMQLLRDNEKLETFRYFFCCFK